MDFRTLYADEIEVRVGTISAKGASLLLYQDGRCAMTLLDETVGSMFWQRDHREIKGNMYCGIGIYDQVLKQWVWKWDCGVESNTEAQKGEASDSFKRAAVNWGIARELYTSPFIFVPCETVQRQGGRGYDLKDRYMFSGAKVSHIEYDETRHISALEIQDSKGAVMYQWKQKTKTKRPPKPVTNPKGKISETDASVLKQILEEKGKDTAKMLGWVERESGYEANSVDELTREQYALVMGVLG